MNRNDAPPKSPTLVADAGSAGVSPERAGDSLADHDPTLKWIISDLAETEEKTPPPIQIATNEHTPPVQPVLLPHIPPSRETAASIHTPPPQPAPLPHIPPSREPAANIRTPPPLVTGPAEEKTPPPETAAMPRTPPPEPRLASQPIANGTSASGSAPLVEAIHGATPADFFAADSTPPPPSPAKSGGEVGAAPVGVLSGTTGSDTELSADAVELIPSTADESGPAWRIIAAVAENQSEPAPSPAEPAHDDTPRDGVLLGAPVPARTSEAPTEPREVEPEAVEMLESVPPATEAQAEPREVEPEAVEMLESAEHQTVPNAESKTQASHAQTPPPVPSVPPEPPAPAIPPPRPLVIAAALFDEYQTPASGADPIPEALARRSLKKRAKPWYEEVFDEDFLRTLPFMTPEQTAREVTFIRDALSPPAGGEVLDVGCGYGRHALELAHQGLRLTGLDLSLPMLIRAADHAQKRGLSVNFVHADMREMTYSGQFDAAYCMLSSFGYFDEETNLRVATAICRALKPGGRFLLDIINRDYIVGDLPSRVWWEGDGCVVLEEVDFNYHTSRVLIRRSVVFGNGRQSEQEISLRAYSLHEVGKLLRQAGLRVLDVSGGLGTKSKFYGASSRNIIAVCERPAP
jgi:SAM-dependent methyltransferase